MASPKATSLKALIDYASTYPMNTDPRRLAAGRSLAKNLAKSTPSKHLLLGLKKWITSNGFVSLSAKHPEIDEWVDLSLGLDERSLKAKLHPEFKKLPKAYVTEQAFLYTPPEELFTPYRLLTRLVQEGPNLPSVVDLGSGLGRLGFVISLLRPGTRYFGYELVQERVRLSRKMVRRFCPGTAIQIAQQDLSRGLGKVAEGDLYFMFNPFTRKTLESVVLGLKRRYEKTKKPFVIASVLTGAVPRVLKSQSWLKKLNREIRDSYWDGHGIGFWVPTKL